MAETKLFSRAEVSKHSDNKSTWLIIHNSVYDVTKFLGEVCLFTISLINSSDTLIFTYNSTF